MSTKVVQFAPWLWRSQTGQEVRPQAESSHKEEPFMASSISQPVGRSRREIWEAFLNDKELLDRYHVTAEEIDSLKTFAPFGTLTGSDDIIYILERIRRSRRRW